MTYLKGTTIKKAHLWLLLALLALTATTACTRNADDEPVACIEIPVHIAVPMQGATRTPGDPGTAEEWLLPTKAYLWVVLLNADGDFMEVKSMVVNLDEARWKLREGTSIYDYTDDVTMQITGDVKAARLYAALSRGTISYSLGDLTSEDDVTHLTFTVPTEGSSEYLRNVYTTPHNLLNEGLTGDDAKYNGQYYGTVRDMNTPVPHVDVICYHVASRLDLLWNVTEEARENGIKVSGIKARGMWGTGYLFRPTEEVTGRNTALDYDLPVLSTTAASGVGTMWNGRATVHVLHPQAARTIGFTFTSCWGVDAKSKDVDVAVPASGSDIYAPWIRAIMTVTLNDLWGTAEPGT